MSTTQMSADQHEVHLGSTVSFTDPGAGREKTFTIVDPHKAKPAEGKLSSISPVGGALLGHRVVSDADGFRVLGHGGGVDR